MFRRSAINVVRDPYPVFVAKRDTSRGAMNAISEPSGREEDICEPPTRRLGLLSDHHCQHSTGARRASSRSSAVMTPRRLNLPHSLRDSRRTPSCGIKADPTTAVLSTRAGAPRIWDTNHHVEKIMTKTTPEQNKAIVLQAFDTLFNKRDYAAAERYWSADYVQHSGHIEPGRQGLFKLIRSLPPTLKYESGTIVADGDFVIVHGRFSGIGRVSPLGKPVGWIAADIVRMEDGLLAEHWDILEDEATEQDSKSGKPMFGERFPA
jgi:predicted SnoaL-like aldol condensation-catalyzing enzyme